MRIIKIFLASSEELTDDRNAFGNLVRRLDKIYEKRGIRIELFEWEDYDAAFNNRRKQDEYNDQIKASDMFLALFHTKAGKFTIEEFDIATEEFKKHASPKVYTYCKDLQEGEQESPELIEFKHRLFEELGHYWCRYNNRDSMQLHFVMQLQLVETNGMVEKLKLEEGIVMLEGMPIAKIDNLQFAAGNEAYQKMSAELADLPEKIEKARMRVERFPDDEDLRDDLQQKIDLQNSLQKKLKELQENLFLTARRIVRLQQQRISISLQRAMDAFDRGQIEKTNAILDEIDHEADLHMEQLEADFSLAHKYINSWHLQTATIMDDSSISIEDRIKKTKGIFEKALKYSERSWIEGKQHESLLSDYASFLFKYGYYLEAIEMFKKNLEIAQKIYSDNSLESAGILYNLGSSYCESGQFENAIECYLKSAHIKVAMDISYEDVASIYYNIAVVYDKLGDYNRAKDYYVQSLEIRKQLFGENSIQYVRSLNGIGTLCFYHGKYVEAIELFERLVVIMNKIMDKDTIDLAGIYMNLGIAYRGVNISRSLDCLLKSKNIFEKLAGPSHLSTASCYVNLCTTLTINRNFPDANNCILKAISIYSRNNNPTIELATAYSGLAALYVEQFLYKQAIEKYKIALDIFNNILGNKHLYTIQTEDNIRMLEDALLD